MIHPIQTANPTHGISPKHKANPSIARNPNTTIGTVRHGTMIRTRQIRTSSMMWRMMLTTMKMAMARRRAIHKNGAEVAEMPIMMRTDPMIIIMGPMIRKTAPMIQK